YLWDSVYDSICLYLPIKNIISVNLRRDECIVDAGSGGGLPGIPLAILLNETPFCLIDVNRKKCSFLRAVKARLKLDNVQVGNRKLEDIEPSSLIITRAAFSSSNVGTLALAARPGGKIVIWSTPQKV